MAQRSPSLGVCEAYRYYRYSSFDSNYQGMPSEVIVVQDHTTIQLRKYNGSTASKVLLKMECGIILGYVCKPSINL